MSAVLFASATTATLLAVLLFYLAPLPTLIAGLRSGATTALVAGAAGLAVVLVALGLAPAAGYLFSLALPVTVLTYLALLSRQAAGDVGAQGGVEWYPVGRLVMWTAVMAGGLAALSIPLLGLSAEAYEATVRDMLDNTILKQLGDSAPQGLDKDALAPVVDLLVRALPAISAMVWLLVMVFNLWTAGRIIDASGNALRPWPDLSAMTFPTQFSLAFAVCLLLTFAPGLIGIIAMGFVGAFFLAYLLLGLAIFHAITRASQFRPLLLFSLYFGMFLFLWVALIVAAVGVGDPVFKLRERAFNRSNQPPSGGPD